MRKLCAARRAVEDVFGISSANPFGTHCDVHGGPNLKAFVPDSKPDDRFDVDPSSAQQHVRFHFFTTLTALMLKLGVELGILPRGSRSPLNDQWLVAVSSR